MVVALDDESTLRAMSFAATNHGACSLAAARRAALLQAADADALALAERVERQADVLADHAAAVVLDRPGRVGEVAVEELAKRPLADEADAGRVLLRRVRQADLGGDAPHLGLASSPTGNSVSRQLRLVEAMQEYPVPRCPTPTPRRL